jgi:hypothetical protein
MFEWLAVEVDKSDFLSLEPLVAPPGIVELWKINAALEKAVGDAQTTPGDERGGVDTVNMGACSGRH